MMLDDETVESYIDDCVSAMEARNCPFSVWERRFLESIFEQWNDGKALTLKQCETLESIWEKI